MLTSRTMLTAGIAAFVALDFALVASALHTPAPPRASALTTSGSTVKSASPDRGSNPSHRRSGTSPTPRALPLSAASSAVAMRTVAAGSCHGGGARLQRTSDGGRSWQDASSPFASVLRLRVNGPTSAFVVATESSCVAHAFTTTDQGRSWQRADSTIGIWYLTPPSSGGRIHVPSGLIADPCSKKSPAVDLKPVGANGGVLLCGNGRVFLSVDDGASFDRRGKAGAAMAVAFLSASHGFVAGTSAGCSGAAVRRTTDGGATWSTAACVTTADPKDGLGLAFSARDAGLLVVGQSTYASRDAGDSWSRL